MLPSFPVHEIMPVRPDQIPNVGKYYAFNRLGHSAWEEIAARLIHYGINNEGWTGVKVSQLISDFIAEGEIQAQRLEIARRNTKAAGRAELVAKWSLGLCRFKPKSLSLPDVSHSCLQVLGFNAQERAIREMEAADLVSTEHLYSFEYVIYPTRKLVEEMLRSVEAAKQ